MRPLPAHRLLRFHGRKGRYGLDGIAWLPARHTFGPGASPGVLCATDGHRAHLLPCGVAPKSPGLWVAPPLDAIRGLHPDHIVSIYVDAFVGGKPPDVFSVIPPDGGELLAEVTDAQRRELLTLLRPSRNTGGEDAVTIGGDPSTHIKAHCTGPSVLTRIYVPSPIDCCGHTVTFRLPYLRDALREMAGAFELRCQRPHKTSEHSLRPHIFIQRDDAGHVRQLHVLMPLRDVKLPAVNTVQEAVTPGRVTLTPRTHDVDPLGKRTYRRDVLLDGIGTHYWLANGGVGSAWTIRRGATSFLETCANIPAAKRELRFLLAEGE